MSIRKFAVTIYTVRNKKGVETFSPQFATRTEAEAHLLKMAKRYIHRGYARLAPNYMPIINNAVLRHPTGEETIYLDIKPINISL